MASKPASFSLAVVPRKYSSKMASIKFLLDETSRLTSTSTGVERVCSLFKSVKKIVISLIAFVGVGVLDGVRVGVDVKVAVGVFDGVREGVNVAVAVAVLDGVKVGVFDGVSVGVKVLEGVLV
jgi:hypothetical protein